ncbi:hypothetical protein QAD02_023875 [Eretmocerus hayati]|uniref:Uncharacterized protein n=1 Tax=Eretmocerus hayati TaxID=131215 RepID=A0ACC2Q1Z1_9HYME|nr:hypothetical protein QAD02_023875 [Eretmocerus hayati]
MILAKVVFALTVFAVDIEEIFGHGKLMKPISRASRWRDSRFADSERHYTDNQFFAEAYTRNNFKCGVCGDPYNEIAPRETENGGRYGTGTIVETYKRGQRIAVTVSLDANHGGYFKFAVCPLSENQPETEECFRKYPLKFPDGSRLLPIKESYRGKITVYVDLPKNLSCKHCSFRWHYRCGNNSHKCKDGVERRGCSLKQEIFRGCADISIL